METKELIERAFQKEPPIGKHIAAAFVKAQKQFGKWRARAKEQSRAKRGYYACWQFVHTNHFIPLQSIARPWLEANFHEGAQYPQS